MSTWSESAHAVMLTTLIECDRAGMSKAETAKAIDAAYPFGVRAHYPYKAWLKVRKSFFAQHGLPRNGDHRTTKDRLDDLVARMGARRGWGGDWTDEACPAPSCDESVTSGANRTTGGWIGQP
jgi:hypothetical protein